MANYNYSIIVDATLAPGSGKKLEAQLGKVKVNPKAVSGMKELNKQTGLFSQNLVDVGKKILEWTVLTKVIFGTINAIKDGVKEVSNLNRELIEMRKVTDLTTDELAQFTKEAMSAGDAVARTTTEMISATAIWARMGFTAKEALDLASQSAILTNVAESIDSVEESSSVLISTLKGFNLTTDQAGDVVDRLNNISNKYAVTIGDLAAGVKRVAPSMAAANNDIDETIALMTTATEVLRNAARASVGLRTISMRLRGVAEDGSAIGGLIPELQDYFDTYGTGVELIDDVTGSFNSTYDILNQLSTSWSTLTDLQRANLTELIAGKRQSDVLNSVLANTETLTNSLSDSQTSLGSALRENAIYMESIEAKTQMFNKAMKDVWIKTISQDAIKGLVDFGTQLIKIVDTVGLLNVAFVLGATVIGAKLLPQVTALNIALGLTSAEIMLIASLIGVGLYAAFDALTVSIKEQREQVSLLESEISSLRDEYNKLKDAENKTAEQEAYLSQLETELWLKQAIYDLERKNLAERELDRYGAKGSSPEKTIQAQADGITKLNIRIIELKKSYEGLTKEQINELPAKEQDKLYNAMSKVEELEGRRLKQLSQSSDFIDEYIENMRLAGRVVPDEISDTVDFIRILIEELENQSNVSSDAVVEQEKHNDALQDYDLTVEQLADNLDDLNSTLDDLQSEYESLNSVIDDLNEGLSLSGSETLDLIQKYPQLINSLEETEDGYRLNANALEILRDAKVEQMKVSIQASIDEAKAVIESTKGIVKAYSTRVASIQTLAEAEMLLSRIVQESLFYEDREAYADTIASYEKIISLFRQLEAIGSIDLSKLGSSSSGSKKSSTKEDIVDLRDVLSDLYGQFIDITNDQIDALGKELDILNEQKDVLQEQWEIEDEINTIYDARIKLLQLQNQLSNVQQERNVQLFTGSGWEWVADPRAVRAAEQALADQQKTVAELEEEKLRNEQIRAIEKQIDAIELQQDMLKEQIAVARDQIDAIDRQSFATSQLASAIDQLSAIVVAMRNGDTSGTPTLGDLGAVGTDITVPGTGTTVTGGQTTDGGLVSSTTGLIRSGSTGDSVRALQTALQALGFSPGGIDGIFGTKTELAVRAYQSSRGLSSDGIVGDNTRGKFRLDGFKKGGDVNYTGLAMVHGSKQNPEHMLSADVTKGVVNSMNSINAFTELMSGVNNGSASQEGLGTTIKIENMNVKANNANELVDSIKLMIPLN